jgi:hypothetical protein
MKRDRMGLEHICVRLFRSVLVACIGVSCSVSDLEGLEGPGRADCNYSPERDAFPGYLAPIVDGCMRYQAARAFSRVTYCNTCEAPRALSSLTISGSNLGGRLEAAIGSGLIIVDAEGGSLDRCERSCVWRSTERPPTSIVFVPARTYFDVVLPFSMLDSTDSLNPRTVLAILALPRFSRLEDKPDSTGPLVDLRALCEAVDRIPPLAPDAAAELPAVLAALEQSYLFQVVGTFRVPGRAQPRVPFEELCEP